MKRIILAILISIASSISAYAQVDEKISELKPYADYLKSIQNYYPGDIFIPPQQSPVILSTLSVIPLRLSNGKQVTAIIARGAKTNLAFENISEQQFRAELFILGRIISDDKKIDGVFTDTLVFNNSLEEMNHFVDSSIFYRKLLDLPQGNYQLQFISRNEIEYSKKIIKIKFTVL